MIKIKNLKIRYKKRHIVTISDFSAKRGEVVIIYGPSGSGKSSFLQFVGLIEKFPCQKYHFLGKNILNKSETQLGQLRRNEIGYLFQDKNLFDQMSVYENLMTYGMMTGHQLTKKHLREILHKVYLDVPFKQKVYTLSGGEKQRLALACILVKQPTLILADEPTSGLDDETKRIVMTIFHDLAKKEQCCVIIISHDTKIQTNSDRIYVIEKQQMKLQQDPVPPRLEVQRKVPHQLSKKLVSYYLKHSGLLYSMYVKILIVFLSIVCAVSVCTGLTAKDMVAKANKQMASDMMIVESKTAITENDFYYISQIKGITKSNLCEVNKVGDLSLIAYHDENLMANEIMISEQIAEALNLKVEDSLKLSDNQECLIKAIIPKQNEEAYQNIVYMSLDKQNLNQVLIQLDKNADREKTQEILHHYHEDLYLRSLESNDSVYSQSLQLLVTYLKTCNMVIYGILVVLMTALLCMEAKNHQYEFALLKANGIPNSTIFAIVFRQSLIHAIWIYSLGLVLCIIYKFVIYDISIVIDAFITLIPYITMILFIPVLSVMLLINHYTPNRLLKGL